MLGTPVGSLVVDKKNKPADTGARAQRLAELLGVPVMAYQELGPKVPLTGLPAARRLLTAGDFPEYTAECASTLQARLCLGGIQKVIVRAHSGNGPLGTGLCLALPDASKDITVSHLALSDPVGMRSVSFFQGLGLWHRYNSGPAKNTPLDHRTEGRHPSNTVSAFLRDVVVRGTTTWLTDCTLQNLTQIAESCKQTAVNIHLPGNTLNGTPGEMESVAAALNEMGIVNRSKRDAPFIAHFVPGDHHSSAYDSHVRNAGFILQTVELALFPNSSQ